MALLDEEWIKRILSGNFSGGDLAQKTGQIPVPAQRPIEAVTLGPQDAVVPPVRTPETPTDTGYEATGLLGLLPKSMQPESEQSQQALARAMLLGGASAMANPGQNWMSSVGQIIGNGVQAYDGSLASQLKTQEEQQKAKAAADAQQLRDTMAAQIAQDDGALGYSMAKLRQLFAYYTKIGDDTSARQVQGQMMELSKQAAQKGLVLDEKTGKFVPAEGYEQGVNQLAESEAAAKKRGEESETRTEPQRNIDRINEQRKAMGLEPITDQTFIEEGRETPAIKEWKFGAKDPEFRAAQDMGKQKASTKITDKKGNEYPAPDKGYRYVDAGDGTLKLEMIPGGEADLKQQDLNTKKDNSQTAKERAADVVTMAIDDVFASDKSATLPTTGLLGSVTQYIPGTASHDISNTLDTIKANTAFDKISEMRANSPTGGALGSVTENELRLLQSSVAALEQSQTDEQFKRNLNRVYNYYLDTVHGKGNGPERRPDNYGTAEYADAEKAKEFLKKSADPKPKEAKDPTKGTYANPIVIHNEDEIDDLPAGTVVLFNGKPFRVQ